MAETESLLPDIPGEGYVQGLVNMGPDMYAKLTDTTFPTVQSGVVASAAIAISIVSVVTKFL
jgi:hypothetical protein